jgi:hypothetical protein
VTALTSQYPTKEHSSIASTLSHLPRFQGTGIPGSVEQTATKVPLGMDAPTEPRKTKRLFVPRMKTSCMTCRQRKKKCDEAKPHCNNCKRGNLQCGGYREKVPWRGRLAPASESLTAVRERRAAEACEPYSGGTFSRHIHVPIRENGDEGCLQSNSHPRPDGAEAGGRTITGEELSYHVPMLCDPQDGWLEPPKAVNPSVHPPTLPPC